jgi:hypothetical protein
LRAELSKLDGRLGTLSEENSLLMSDIKYYSYPENLEKKLKEGFNYKGQGEEMMIIVP